MDIVQMAVGAGSTSSSVGGGDWDLSQERAFIENLLCQRFNFLLVLFAVVVAAAAATQALVWQVCILGAGAVMCGLVGLTVYRSHVKLDLILSRLKKMPGHAVAVIEQDAKALGCRALFSVRPILGVFVPILCACLLFVGMVLVLASRP
ncbi:MAG: hypothetical protein U1E39_09485 [Planctomycetota bacterium]